MYFQKIVLFINCIYQCQRIMIQCCIIVYKLQPSLTEIFDAVTSRHLNYSLVIWEWDLGSGNFSFVVCLQINTPALNVSVNCHNFSESMVKVETGDQ